MSVLIRGMQMPRNCMSCPVKVGTFCQILNIDVDPFYDGGTARNAQCPLVDLESHGDLIDRAEAQTELQFAARRYTVTHEAHGEGQTVWSDNLISVTDAMNALRKVPSAQPESFGEDEE